MLTYNHFLRTEARLTVLTSILLQVWICNAKHIQEYNYISTKGRLSILHSHANCKRAVIICITEKSFPSKSMKGRIVFVWEI